MKSYAENSINQENNEVEVDLIIIRLVFSVVTPSSFDGKYWIVKIIERAFVRGKSELKRRINGLIFHFFPQDWVNTRNNDKENIALVSLLSIKYSARDLDLGWSFRLSFSLAN